MPEQQQIAPRSSTQRNDAQPFEAAERLEVLFGEHAFVAEQLRGLHGEIAAVQSPDESEWNNLESLVVRLRHQVEDFKQTFSTIAEPHSFTFDPEVTLNFLSLET